MTELCTKVVREHMVRKGQKRKQAFREMVKAALREKGVFFREERAKGLITNANLVFGNVRTAEFILGAHYDTLRGAFVSDLSRGQLDGGRRLSTADLRGPVRRRARSGRHREIARRGARRRLRGLPHRGRGAYYLDDRRARESEHDERQHLRRRGASDAPRAHDAEAAQARRGRAVDNEEVGLIGSALFRRKYRKAIREKPMINLDCVGDGRHVLFAASRSYREDEALYGRTRDAFRNEDGFSPLHVRAGSALYPSDQFGFPKSVAVAALHKTKFLGYALGRIHTRRDTVLDEKNIEYLVEGLLKLIGHEDE